MSPRLASVHIADVGARGALPTRAPKVDGLLHANVAIAAPLGAGALPRPMIGRLGLVAMWEDDVALDDFLASHPLAARLAGGWSARLTPLRRFGSWPGLAEEIPRARNVEHAGPAVVLTLGRLRLRRALPFFRTSAKAEAAVVVAPGLRWATGLAKPPFVATCSIWDGDDALSAYAYGHDEPAHSHAIDADRAKPFHHESAFVRFRPYDVRGSLTGRNPLSATALADL